MITKDTLLFWKREFAKKSRVVRPLSKKQRKTKQLIVNTERRNPLGQKQLAKQLGVSTRTLRYWKTGERKPTKTHTSKLKAKHNLMKSYIRSVAKSRRIPQHRP